MEIVDSQGDLTEEDLIEMRADLKQLAGWETQTAFYITNTRMNIELLGAIMNLRKSIRQFDETSTKLIETTNSLTERIRRLTFWGLTAACFGTLLAGASLAVSIVTLFKTWR